MTHPLIAQYSIIHRPSTGWPKKVSHYQMIKKSY